MKDRIVEHPNRYKLNPVMGEVGVYDLAPVPGIVTEVGTPINKATLLSDETSLVYNGALTVNEAFINLKTPKVFEITSSIVWTMPNGYNYVDVYLVGGGYNGTNGSFSSSGGGRGGRGGDGGKIAMFTGIRISSGTSVSIQIGARNGGTTVFGDFSTSGSDFQITTPSSGPANYSKMTTLLSNTCPFNNKVYGSDGAEGGTANEASSIYKKGESCGPYSGGTGTYARLDIWTYFGGGGAALGTNGSAAVSPRAGNGATARSNSGGGGGGGGGASGSYQASNNFGVGGSGAAGVCIIRCH